MNRRLRFRSARCCLSSPRGQFRRGRLRRLHSHARFSRLVATGALGTSTRCLGRAHRPGTWWRVGTKRQTCKREGKQRTISSLQEGSLALFVLVQASPTSSVLIQQQILVAPAGVRRHLQSHGSGTHACAKRANVHKDTKRDTPHSSFGPVLQTLRCSDSWLLPRPLAHHSPEQAPRKAGGRTHQSLKIVPGHHPRAAS